MAELRRQARLDLERDRHVRLERRVTRVHEEHVVETEIARAQGHHARIAAARRRIDRPASRRAARGGVDRRRVRVLVKGQQEIVVDGLLAERLVLDLEMAARKPDAVERLARSRHRVDDPERDEPEIGRCAGRRGFGRGGRRQFDGRRVRIRRGRDRKRAVRAQAQSQIETVEFEPPDLDLEGQQRKRVEADPAARRGKNGAAGAIADGDAAETERDAAVHAHEVGRADRDGEARSQALLQTLRDPRIQAFDVDRTRSRAGRRRRRAPPAPRRGRPRRSSARREKDAARRRQPPGPRQSPPLPAAQQALHRRSGFGPCRCVDFARPTPCRLRSSNQSNQ